MDLPNEKYGIYLYEAEHPDYVNFMDNSPVMIYKAELIPLSFSELNKRLGFFEVAPCDVHEVDIFVGSESAYLGQRPNSLATAIWALASGHGNAHVALGDRLCGPAVVCGPPDAAGDSTSPPPWIATLLWQQGWLTSMEVNRAEVS